MSFRKNIADFFKAIESINKTYTDTASRTKNIRNFRKAFSAGKKM